MKTATETVANDLVRWLTTQQSAAVRNAGTRVLMSLDFCRRSGSGLRELAEDVEMLRQARFGSVQTPADPDEGLPTAEEVRRIL
jgi:hypothetical protein